MNKIKFITYTVVTLIGMCLLASCEKDDDIGSSNAEVSVMYTDNDTINANSGYPHTTAIAKGTDMGDIKTIVFDNKIDVIFNPALNSDVAVVFEVPFDELKGSRFGVQEVTFTKNNGAVFTTQFNILQPPPSIKSSNAFDPERPEIGTPVTVTGSWFYDVESVTFGGQETEFEVLSSTELSFIVPEDASGGGDVIIESQAGPSEPAFLDIYLGFDVLLITDFDGNGLRPDNNWVGYGDYATLEYKNTDGIDEMYAELVWNGADANGYNGAQSDAGADLIEFTDPEQVHYAVDINCNGAVGTVVDFLVVDSDGGNWAYRHTFTADDVEQGWITISAPLSAFGANYDPNNQDSGDVDPSKINQVKVSISQGSGVIPSIVQYDNIRFHVYEGAVVEPEPEPEPEPAAANLVSNGGFEEGDGDDFTNWTKQNGGDRMTAETADVHGGSRALAVSNPGAGEPWHTQLISDNMTTEIGVTYTASMWIKGDAGTVRFSTTAAAGAIYGPDFTVSSEWQLYTWEFEANDTAIGIVLDMGASAANYIVDDVSVAVNLVANGGFEEGDGDDFTNWTKQNGGDRMTAETTDVYEGARAMAVSNPGDGSEWETQLISDAMATELGIAYTVSMWIKGDADGGVVRFSTNEDTPQYGPNYTVTTEWQRVTWTFTATSESTRLALDMGASAGNYVVDEVKVVAN